MARLKATITRRDFINSTLVGAGATLLSGCAPKTSDDISAAAKSGRAFPPPTAPAGDWHGYGGVGDYRTSHGNTPELVANAHNIRHGKYDAIAADWVDTGEFYDCIIVGAGMAGLGAALEFTSTMPASARCLMLDNHPVFGGESKQNEFEVNGYRLTGPQGANGFSIPAVSRDEELTYAGGDAFYYDLLGVPRELKYAERTGGAESIDFGNDNFGFLHWMLDRIDISHFFKSDGVGQHAINTWRDELRNLNVPDDVRKSFLEWQNTIVRPHAEEGLAEWLDSMSCKHYLENVLGLDPAVTAYVDNIIAAGVGSGCDVTSAYVLYAVGLPGFKGYRDPYLDNRHSFPGGNTGFARHFIKKIKPGAIAGGNSFADIINGGINFGQLDRPGDPFRLRLSSTVVRVEHEGSSPENSDSVIVSYIKNQRIYRVRAKTVVMASGGWINKHVVRDLPDERFAAYDSFNHAAFLVANVALTNWKFLQNLGVSGCIYQGDFGFACNLRNPMVVGDHEQPHDPNKPAILTFYVPMISPGLSAAEQGNVGRMTLFSTSYASYEQKIVQQMNELFAAAGFNAEQDVAGIILNRWGHAYLMPEAGIFFGRDGTPPPTQTVSQRYGRIGFGHSELKVMQHWGPAALEGRRALNDIRPFI